MLKGFDMRNAEATCLSSLGLDPWQLTHEHFVTTDITTKLCINTNSTRFRTHFSLKDAA